MVPGLTIAEREKPCSTAFKTGLDVPIPEMNFPPRALTEVHEVTRVGAWDDTCREGHAIRGAWVFLERIKENRWLCRPARQINPHAGL